MNSSTNHATAQEEDEEDYRKTPERPVYSPLTQEIAKQNATTPTNLDSNGLEIKSEPQNEEKTEDNQLTTEITRLMQTGLDETIQNVREVNVPSQEVPFDPSEVRIKDDPDAEETHIIDYGMPLSKTPGKSNPLPLFTDLDDTRLLATTNDKTSERTNEEQVNVLQENLAKAANLNEGAAKTALDALLDGLQTPLAPTRPRLRVKTEFSFVAPTPQRESSKEKDNEAMDTDDNSPPPPPPPFISATSDSLAEGIATPHLSLAAVNRLRVKSEFSLPDVAPEEFNDDTLAPPDDEFFKDLLPSEEIKKEDGEASASGSGTEEEDIPSDYFDDLTQDQIKERIEQAQNCELEEKYSERLKRLQELEKKGKHKEKHKNRKKQKKSKKKSRKRSRSRSLTPTRKSKERKHNDEMKPRDYEYSRRTPEPPEMPSSSQYREPEEIVNSSGIKIKSEFATDEFENVTEASSAVVENVEDIMENLTPKQRKERAIRRAQALLNYLKQSSEDNSTIFSTFPFVSTVRKLPTSHSYVQQQIYENRSPLHTVNNVSYKFNSHTTRFNMEEWGLAALPTHAAKLARLVGCDAQFIHEKLKTIKIPAKLKKIKQENNQQEVNEEEELVETTSSLYANAMTQTEDTEEFEGPRKSRGYEIGVQVEPDVFSIGTQTLETQSPTEDMHKDDEAPIMKIIRDLNENQLMAIHAFAELIKMPNSNTNAMEMYKIQMQIMDIYKMSQIPSALVTQQTQSVNNYSTTTRNLSPPRRPSSNGGQQQSPIMHIQSVKSGDGKEFVMNDPRAKSAAYTKRIANDGAGSSSNYDNRYTAGYTQSSHGRSNIAQNNNYSSNGSRSSYERSYNGDFTNNSSTIRSNHYAANHPVQPTTTKRYGRGAARR